jgi:hypothetical protein
VVVTSINVMDNLQLKIVLIVTMALGHGCDFLEDRPHCEDLVQDEILAIVTT